MSWTREQQERLRFEYAILQRYLGDFEWKDPTANTRIEGWMRSNAGNPYYARLYVPSDVPNSVPTVVLTKPNPLYDHRGRNLCNDSPSRSMHILSPVDGCVSICHHSQTKWTPAITFYKVLMKVRLWLEAYEAHRLSGKPIDHYLRHQ